MSFKFNIGDRVAVYRGWEKPLFEGTISNRRNYKMDSLNIDQSYYLIIGQGDEQFAEEGLVKLELDKEFNYVERK